MEVRNGWKHFGYIYYARRVPESAMSISCRLPVDYTIPLCRLCPAQRASPIQADTTDQDSDLLAWLVCSVVSVSPRMEGPKDQFPVPGTYLGLKKKILICQQWGRSTFFSSFVLKDYIFLPNLLGFIFIDNRNNLLFAILIHQELPNNYEGIKFKIIINLHFMLLCQVK